MAISSVVLIQPHTVCCQIQLVPDPSTNKDCRGATARV